MARDAGEADIDMASARSTGRARSSAEGADRRRELVRLIQKLARSRGPGRVFADFIELSCLSLSNAVDRSQFDTRESRYHEIRKSYSYEEFEQFPQMLGLLTMVMETAGFDDVLGSLYMELELGNARSGQFFTPYTVSRMMAMMMVGDASDVRESGVLDAAEPACGAGGMVVAMADALLQAGVNYQQHLHVTCTDIDLRCVHMTYLQASLLHIPAVVLHGNALSTEVWSRWYTPAHILGGWTQRLERYRQARAVQGRPATDDPVPASTDRPRRNRRRPRCGHLPRRRAGSRTCSDRCRAHRLRFGLTGVMQHNLVIRRQQGQGCRQSISTLTRAAIPAIY